MNAWLLGFVFGTIAGLSGLSLAPWLAGVRAAAGMLVLLALILRARRHGIVLAALGGVLWGGGHAAPPPSSSLRDVTIVAVNGAYGGRGDVLVRQGSRVFQVYGPQIQGASGDVRVRPWPSVLSSWRASFIARHEPAVRRLPWLEWSDRLRELLVNGARHFSWSDAQWLSGIVAGERSGFNMKTDQAFRDTGLYHLLVVSGQHVTLVAIMLGAFFALPLRALYALRLIPPRVWWHVAGGLAVVASLLGFIYAAATGLTAASQRAATTFAVLRLSGAFAAWMPLKARLIASMVVQSVLFPIGCLSEASLMSWGASLLVIAMPRLMPNPGGRVARRRRNHSESHPWHALMRGVAQASWLQFKLTLLAAALFGYLAWLSIPANLILVPVFGAILTSGFVLCLWPTLPGAALILEVHRNFGEIVGQIATLADRWPFLSVPPENLPSTVRLACLAVSAVFLLNTVHDLTIRQAEVAEPQA